MKFTLTSLKKYLETEASVQELSETLTRIGLEVEEIIDKGAALKDDFCVAQIMRVLPHPNADKLHLLELYDGTNHHRIVCGAPNVRENLKVIFAREGALIPLYNERLKKAVIRGEESCGMCCSYKELGLGEDHSGIIEVDEAIPVGMNAADALGAEIVFDINVTPNRGDCFGIVGIARDLAATGIGTFKEMARPKIDEKFPSPVSVKITTDKCTEFTGRVIRGVKNGQSPKWMQNFLTAIGLRPISALVDITNYFCFAEGRPLHVFDVKKLQGNLTVRSAENGEKLLALDGKEYTLSEGMTVVADDKAPQSVAGIMGGELTGCDDDTTEVFLESATFNAINVAETSHALNLESDSKSRFERGVDPLSAESELDKATAMILELCGGEASERVIAGQEEDPNVYVPLKEDKVEKLTGVKIDFEQQKDILKKLNFVEKDGLWKAPSYRTDISVEADLVEEILRIYGYEHLPLTVIRPEELKTEIYTPEQKRNVMLRRALASRGLNQAITWSFMDSKIAKLFGSKGLKIKNPISSELDELRPNLVANLISAFKRNQDKGEKSFAVFELGPEFYGNQPSEQRDIAAWVRGGDFIPLSWEEKSRPATVFDIKKDLFDVLRSVNIQVSSLQIDTGAPSYYHPGKSAIVRQGKNILAVFGEIHPEILRAMDVKDRLVACEIYVENLPLSRNKHRKTAEKASALQPVERDFAFVTDKTVRAGDLIKAIEKTDRNLLSNVTLFDVYEGSHLPEGKKSLAIRVTWTPKEKTLTDAQIEALSQKVMDAVSHQFGAEIRQ